MRAAEKKERFGQHFSGEKNAYQTSNDFYYHKV
jgi:hypothetical protein